MTPAEKQLSTRKNPIVIGFATIVLGILALLLPFIYTCNLDILSAWAFWGKGFFLCFVLSISLGFAKTTLRSNSLFAPMGICIRLGVFLGSVGFTLALVFRLVTLYRPFDALFFSLPMLVLGWIPGLLCGLLLGLLSIAFFSPILLPLLHFQRFPSLDDAISIRKQAGYWLLVLGVFAALLYRNNSVFLSLECLLALFGFLQILFAKKEQISQKQWLSLVCLGKEKYWRILPILAQTKCKRLPIFLREGMEAKHLLCYRKYSKQGPYRGVEQTIPIARVSLAAPD